MTKDHISALSGAIDASKVRGSMSSTEDEKRILSPEDERTLVALADAATAEIDSLNAMYERAAKIEKDTDQKMSERIAAMDESIKKSEAALADPRIAQAIKDFSL